MVRTSVRVSLFVLVMSCVLPRPAAAAEWDFFEWLERLSGPGPFRSIAGLNLTETFACYGVKANTSEEALAVTAGEPELFFDISCGRAARQRVWARLGVNVMRMRGDNDLQYVTVAPLSEDDRKVRVWGVLLVADVSLRPYLDVGAGAGVLRFSGPLFDGFGRFALEPTRVTLKPLAIGNRVPFRWREVLQLRHTTLYVPGGFDDGDFNALLGSFSTRSELQTRFSVVLNLAPFLDAWRERTP